MKKHSKATAVNPASTTNGSRAEVTMQSRPLIVGLDLGDRKSTYCVLDDEGEVWKRGQVGTTAGQMRGWLASLPRRARVALEAGTHSPWVSELISASGHEAVVLDARKNRLIAESYGKNDGVDAATLAWLQRGVDAHLLKRVHHRGTKARQDRAVLKARDALVAARTKLINAARGLVKSNGERLPKCSAESFATKAAGAVPKELEPALLPLIAEVGALTQRLRTMAREIERLCQQDYPETALLQQVNGVGSVTSLTYVLTLERAERLRHHRDAGPWLGLVRKRRKSAQTDPQLRITKCGDRMLRRLMITSAQYVLGPFGADCDLRRFGQRLLAGGGKQAKKRAVVAVARKLAVLLHLLWQTAAVYEPFYQKLAAAPVNAA